MGAGEGGAPFLGLVHLIVLGPGFPDGILMYPCAHMAPNYPGAFIYRAEFFLFLGISYLPVTHGWHWTDGGVVPIKAKSRLNYVFTFKTESRGGSPVVRTACCSGKES